MFGLANSIVDAGPLPARVPGLMRLIPATPHPILFFGEYHGSAHSPAFFGDAVSEVSAFMPVIVILEQNQSEARLVSRYRRRQVSMHDIVAPREWLWAMKAPLQREDGRPNIAMVKLLYKLRALKDHGRVIEIGVVRTSTRYFRTLHTMHRWRGPSFGYRTRFRTSLWFIREQHTQRRFPDGLAVSCHRSAVKARTQAINQLRALLVSAPQDVL